MIGTTINGRYYPRVYSSVLPVPIWQRYMAEAVDGMSVEDFPEAEERYIHGDRVPVPNVVGWGIDGATRYLESEGFQVNVGDPVSNSWADDGDVGATEPISGTQVQPGSTITLRPSQSTSNENDDDDDDSGDEDSGGGDSGGGDNDARSQGGGNADASGPGNSGSDRGNNRDESDPGERGNRGGGRGGD